MQKIKVGISSCLLGENVRYDGGHQHDRYLTDTLGRCFEYFPVCPEVECGMSIPREAMRLVGDAENPRLLTRETHHDHTEQMQVWATKRVEELKSEGLCGFIFKAKSPSSGLFHVKVYNDDGQVTGFSSGLWAKAFTRAFPLLPVEEAGRLQDPDLRENFIERVFTLKRFRDDVLQAPTIPVLMTFHGRNKLLLMAHAPETVHELGRLIAEMKPSDLPAKLATYEQRLLEAMSEHATVPRQVNVLQHMLGYFRDLLDSAERHELLGVIEDYRSEQLPLIVPVTLFKHFIRKYDVKYLADQSYLNPHPLELKLRNHA
jgi:uncharacterized protein YbgA (DUF1722 family)/uncharacterized protein YbbK (DUF523 family)